MLQLIKYRVTVSLFLRVPLFLRKYQVTIFMVPPRPSVQHVEHWFFVCPSLSSHSLCLLHLHVTVKYPRYYFISHHFYPSFFPLARPSFLNKQSVFVFPFRNFRFLSFYDQDFFTGNFPAYNTHLKQHDTLARSVIQY